MGCRLPKTPHVLYWEYPPIGTLHIYREVALAIALFSYPQLLKIPGNGRRQIHCLNIEVL